MLFVALKKINNLYLWDGFCEIFSFISRTSKKLCMVDVRGQNPPVNESGSQTDISVGQLWRSGLSQTSGIRNK